MTIIATGDADSGSSAATGAEDNKDAGPVYVGPEDGGPRQWEVAADSLNMRSGPSTNSNVIQSLKLGAVLSNLGCQTHEGRVWCDVQPFRGGARGFVAAEYLVPFIDPTGGVAYGEDDSALRAGQGDFDATGTVPCARERGQPMIQCQFGVARAGGGAATVIVTLDDGFRRALFFMAGEFISADASEASGGTDVSSSKEADLFHIRVNDERYEIPEALIYGG